MADRTPRMTVRALSEITNISADKIDSWRSEGAKGRLPLAEEEVLALDAALEAGGELHRLWRQNKEREQQRYDAVVIPSLPAVDVANDEPFDEDASKPDDRVDETRSEGEDRDRDGLDAPFDLQGIRAFLQRAEVRLSTLHRVANALLSGAGILVLLPILVRDSITSVVPHLLAAPVDIRETLLLGALAGAVGLPLYAVLLLTRDIILFFFTGNNFGVGEAGTYFPRFILSGLQLPRDEVRTVDGAAQMDEVRAHNDLLRILIPDNARFRKRVDKRAAAYFRPTPRPGRDGDFARRELLMEFTASLERSLVEEAVKTEYSLTRHVLRIRLLTLRYVKALLISLASAVTAYAISTAATGVSHGAALEGSQLGWISGILISWAAATSLVITTPTRWVYAFSAGDTDNDRGLRRDPELLYFERRALAACTATLASSEAAAWMVVQSGVLTTAGAWALRVVGAVALVVQAVTLSRGSFSRVSVA